MAMMQHPPLASPGNCSFAQSQLRPQCLRDTIQPQDCMIEGITHKGLRTLLFLFKTFSVCWRVDSSFGTCMCVVCVRCVMVSGNIFFSTFQKIKKEQ